MNRLSVRAGDLDVAARQGQRGIVMWVALVVLIVMSIAGLAMVRQMGGGVAIAGNVAFKENATASADSGTEVARAWYMNQSTAILQTDAAPQGYYSTWTGSTDPTTFPWATGSVPVALDAGVGNNSSYIVQRLCQNTGPVTALGQVCSDYELPPADKGGASYGKLPALPEIKPYFRVTTQVIGPRNTVSYTQVILN
jgi:type IV pilus assembly protein PilX